MNFSGTHSETEHIRQAGGMASPLAAPPSASGKPLQGQQETNQNSDAAESSSPAGNAPAAPKESDPYTAAFNFGWQSRLQFGSVSANRGVTFDSVETELEKQWSEKQTASEKRMPWQEARKIAKDAWNQVYDALTESERTEK